MCVGGHLLSANRPSSALPSALLSAKVTCAAEGGRAAARVAVGLGRPRDKAALDGLSCRAVATSLVGRFIDQSSCIVVGVEQHDQRVGSRIG